MLNPGQVIADRYEVMDLVGEGGLAQVWTVRHTVLGSVHAIKLLLFRNKPRLAERLILEGRIQAQLRHPNIVAVTDVVRHGGQVGLVMEFIDGVSLATWLETNAPLDVDRALALFAPVLAGVRLAHEAGVLHRDLKPANILLARQGRGWIPKVTDFGIAKVVEGSFEAVETRTGAAMGTPGYLAPEQAADASRVDQRADLFALSAILYEMLTGRRAFDVNDVYLSPDVRPVPLRELQPDVPRHVADAVMRGLAWDPEHRFANVSDMAAALFEGRPQLYELLHTGVQGEPLVFVTPGAGGAPTRPTLAPPPEPAPSTLMGGPTVEPEAAPPVVPVPPAAAPPRRGGAWMMWAAAAITAASLVALMVTWWWMRPASPTRTLSAGPPPAPEASADAQPRSGAGWRHPNRKKKDTDEEEDTDE